MTLLIICIFALIAICLFLAWTYAKPILDIDFDISIKNKFLGEIIEELESKGEFKPTIGMSFKNLKESNKGSFKKAG